MSSRIEKIMKQYTDRDFEALLSTYMYRCLSFEQLYNLHYKQSIKNTREVGPEYLKKKLTKFKKDGLIEEELHLDSSVPVLYSVTPDGVTSIRKHFTFPSNIYNENRRQTEKGYLTYSEVKVAYRFMPHQYNLNSFTLEANEAFEKYNIENEYYDEKHIPSVLSIRPDAMTITDKFDIYYEMDMGTESKHQLTEKWEHYRSFLRSSKNDPNKKKIILFICNDKGRINNRIDLIKDSISEYFIDCLGNGVELYVGTPKKLMAIIKTKLIHEYFGLGNALCNDLRNALIKSGFQVADGKQLAEYFTNDGFLYYIKQENGTRAYMVDEFFGEPISSIYDALFYDNINNKYIKNFGTKIPLLIVATNEEILLKNCNVFGVESNDILFTTIKRLEKLPFNEAVFKINHGIMYCYNQSYSGFVQTNILPE